ncbi:hypothetical protein AAA799N04_01171 [Marine Group I thaumarchaeote SCGC AAA799-N04]|uniref:Uncharacterized protein n=1 Tax=Marine Group I thaumarchaeote SCGC AAA799-N04 TaxID=1502293 RepID=A0A081RMH6_9ARCH|nr:hypothetical protein AAA799N04_01171 [Marine Group I thaumarchaeote SCGC AAA799-N04]
MEIIGKNIIHTQGRPTKKEQQKVQEIIASYFGVEKTYEEIANETGFNIKTVCKYLKPMYEEYSKRMTEEFLSRHRN